MKFTLLFLSLLLSTVNFAQEGKKTKDARKFQEKLNQEYASKDKSPLTEEDFKTFKSLDFFPIDTSYRVVAQLELIENSEPFKMKTTTDRLPVYKLYAIATFKIKGDQHTLHIYQNQKLIITDEFSDFLFLPFTDQTNGDSTYGGGRYIDLKVPKENTVIIDFNKAYNPYCTYNHKYSCPIPPSENDLKIAIKAGVKAFKK